MATSGWKCRECNACNDYWMPRCPRCGLQGGMVEHDFFAPTIVTTAPEPRDDDGLMRLEDYDPFEGERVSTGIPSVDTLFGHNPVTNANGIHFPSTTLWAGKAGLGKTTLLLQILAHVLRTTDVRCALVSAEMKGPAIRAMVIRLGLDADLRKMKIIVTDNFRDMISQLHKARTQLVVLDSINEMINEGDNPNDEFTNQDRMMKVLIDDAAVDPNNYRAYVIVSHLNADEKVAGKKKMQHKCDTVAMLSEEGFGKIVLECPDKNRLGKKRVKAFFRMDENNGRMIEIPQIAMPAPPPVESGALVPITTVVAKPVDIAVVIAAPLVAADSTVQEEDIFEAPQVPITDVGFEGLLARGAKRKREREASVASATAETAAVAIEKT